MHCYTGNKHRIWEIDFIRGIAIVLMILFHLIVDLKDFHNYELNYLQGFWYIEGKLSAILFILLCGVSSTLGSSRSILHGSKVLLWATLLTTVTFFYNESFYIRFGILHFLGISLLSAQYVRKLSITWLLNYKSSDHHDWPTLCRAFRQQSLPISHWTHHQHFCFSRLLPTLALVWSFFIRNCYRKIILLQSKKTWHMPSPS